MLLKILLDLAIKLAFKYLIFFKQIFIFMFNKKKLFKERIYKLIPHVEQLAIHFQIDGNLIHKESEEAKRQMTNKKEDIGKRTLIQIDKV